MAHRDSPWLAKLKRLDVYTKTSEFWTKCKHRSVVAHLLRPPDDAVYKRSSLGGVFALLVFVIMFGLFVFELGEWLRPRTKDTLAVDIHRNERLTISFDITFHKLPCEDVTIDLLDESGAHFSAIGHDVKKLALDDKGNHLHTYIQGRLSDAGETVSLLQQPGYCHSCLTELPEEAHVHYVNFRKANQVPACCNTCPALVMTYTILRLNSAVALTKQPCRPAASNNRVQGEVGCRATGHIDIHKIGGNFHVAAGKSGTQDHGTHTHHMHRVNFETLKDFNISHTIGHLHFGEGFHGKVDPLNGVTQWERELAQYTYFVNVVPTVMHYASGREVPSHQYSYTMHREMVNLGGNSDPLRLLFFSAQQLCSFPQIAASSCRGCLSSIPLMRCACPRSVLQFSCFCFFSLFSKACPSALFFFALSDAVLRAAWRLVRFYGNHLSHDQHCCRLGQKTRLSRVQKYSSFNS